MRTPSTSSAVRNTPYMFRIASATLPLQMNVPTRPNESEKVIYWRAKGL